VSERRCRDEEREESAGRDGSRQQRGGGYARLGFADDDEDDACNDEKRERTLRVRQRVVTGG
jgi:hypothetical protein